MFTVINVYAPVQVSERERLFTTLIDVVASAVGPVVLCSDFNCTLLETRDRSYRLRWNKHDSPALRQLLSCGGLSDVSDDDLGDDDTELEWSLKHHTYCYILPGGREASCRLDR